MDAILEALADLRRRTALRRLRDSSAGVASYAELAEAIAGRATDLPVDEAAIRLHHVDLPALAAANLVEVDRRSRTARYRPHPLVEDLLDLLDRTSAQAA